MNASIMHTASLVLALTLAAGDAAAQAGASLKAGTLTPYGAERGASKDGSIPAWDGKPVATAVGADNKRADQHVRPLTTQIVWRRDAHPAEQDNRHRDFKRHAEGHKQRHDETEIAGNVR